MYTTYRISEYRQEVMESMHTNGVVDIPDASETTTQQLESFASGATYDEVCRWGTNFRCLLRHPVGHALFQEFLALEHSQENLQFWDAAQQFKQSSCEMKTAKEIHERFFSSNSSAEVCIDSNSKRTIEQRLAANNIGPDLYDAAQHEVYRTMARDSYRRFIGSTLYENMLYRQITAETVQTWADSYESLMQHQIGLRLFQTYLKSIKADENLRFWEAVQEFKMIAAKNKIDSDLRKIAQQIYDEFMDPQSSTEICIDGPTRISVQEKLSNASADIFNEAESHVYKLLNIEAYRKFIKSPLYVEFLRQRSGKNS